MLCGKFPTDWEADLLSERPPASFDATYRKLTYTKGDLHAALIQPQPGRGAITILHVDVNPSRQTQGQVDSAPQPISPIEDSKPQNAELREDESQEDLSIEQSQSPVSNLQSPVSGLDTPLKEHSGLLDQQQSSNSPILNSQSSPSITEEQLDEMADFAAHVLQPSAYAIPPRPEELTPPIQSEPRPATTQTPSTPRSFPPSIPRAKTVKAKPEPVKQEAVVEESQEEVIEAEENDETPVDVVATPTAEKSDAHKIATPNGEGDGRRNPNRAARERKAGFVPPGIHPAPATRNRIPCE
ncbi:MAG: hypothetical protein U0X92_10290 [Anaerolineales bacterium]